MASTKPLEGLFRKAGAARQAPPLNPLSPVDTAFARSPGAIQLYSGDGVFTSPFTSQISSTPSAPPYQPLFVPYNDEEEDMVGGMPPVGSPAPPVSSVLPPVGLPAPVVGNGLGVGDGGEVGQIPAYVAAPPPVRKEIPVNSYTMPTAPQAPEFQAAPVRQMNMERNALNKGTLLSALTGLVLGGAPGAVAAAKGFRDAGQQNFDSQFAGQLANVNRGNEAMQAAFRNQMGQYGAGLDAVRMQMAGDDRDAALIERENANKDRAYNQGEANRIKVYNAGVADRAKGEVRRILQQRADAGDLNAQTNLMGMVSMIEDRKQRADLAGEQFDFKREMEMLGYDFKTKQFDWQKQYQNRMAGVAEQNATTNAARLKLSREAGEATRQIQRDRLALVDKAKGGKDPNAFTPVQQLDHARQLASAEAEIATLRNKAGAMPTQAEIAKNPNALNEWKAVKGQYEESAQEKRKYYDDLATLSGYRRTGSGYEKIVVSGVPRTAADPGYDAPMRGTPGIGKSSGVLQGLGVPPRVLSKAGVPANPPKTLEGQGKPPVINPAAQSGNRAAMSKAATPAPRSTPPAPKPKNTMSNNEIRRAIAERILKGAK